MREAWEVATDDLGDAQNARKKKRPPADAEEKGGKERAGGGEKKKKGDKGKDKEEGAQGEAAAAEPSIVAWLSDAVSAAVERQQNTMRAHRDELVKARLMRRKATALQAAVLSEGPAASRWLQRPVVEPLSPIRNACATGR